MKVGDLVRIEGGNLRPPWYGEIGVVVATSPNPKVYSFGIWYEVVLTSSGRKFVRDDMLVVLDESR